MVSLSLTPYKDGYYPFPRHDIHPSKKDSKWHKDFCESIFAAWVAGNSGIPYSKINKYKELRLYGDGKQPISKYQNLLLDTDQERPSDTGNREGFLNVNWEIFSVAPKFKAVVMGIMESQEHSIVANAVDKLSGLQREENKWNTWFESIYRRELRGIKKSIGVDVKSGGYLPETLQELELFQNMGGFKLRKEASMEQGMDYSFYVSDWARIKRKIVEDFVDINVAGVKDYIDPYSKKVRCRYCNPARSIIQFSKSKDFNNAEYAGEIIRMTITDLRKYTKLTEDQLREVAHRYNAIGGNPDYSDWSEDYLHLTDGSYKYDGFWIDVLDCEFKTVNNKFYSNRKDKHGNVQVNEQTGKEYGRMFDTSKRKTNKKTIHTVQRAKWIIGTDYVFDWGQQFDIPRPGKKEVSLSYHFYKLPGRSIMDMIVPNLDQIQLTWLKMQNAIAMASPAGIAVEWTALQNMKLGGDKMDPLEILEIRRATGDLVYRATTHKGYVQSPNAGRPIQEIEGGIGRQLDEFVRIFETNFEFIRDITGINQIADASSPNPEQSVFGSKLAIAGTSNALKNIYTGYIDIKEKVARNMSMRLQIKVKYDKEVYEGYYPILGKANLEVLRIGAEVVDVDYHIKVEARPTEEMKQIIRTAALESMKPDRDGYIGLEMGDYLLIENILQNGDLKFAQAMISYRSAKNKERQRQVQKENMQLNAQNEQQTAKVKSDEVIRQRKADTDEKIRFDTVQTNNKIRLEKAKHINEMEQIKLKEREAGIRDLMGKDNEKPEKAAS